MSSTPSLDETMRELGRLRKQLPEMIDALAQQWVSGESAGGSVRVSCTVLGDVAEVEIDTSLVRESWSGEVDAAILEALQRAQAAAAQLLARHREGLQFLGVPVGDLLSGRRSLSDLVGRNDE